jgi:uncharacterized protein
VTDYIVLPFNFKYMTNNDTLLVNQAGEYTILNKKNFLLYINKKLPYNSECYKLLKAKHFLTIEEEKNLVLDMLAIKLRTRKAYLLDFTSLHMIVITLRCNCLCKYCHASSVDLNYKNYDMSWNIAKKTIEMIFQTPSLDIKIEYQGGEPLLNWEILKQSILYAEFINKIAKKKLGFVICTNLMDITKEQIMFCKKHNVEISTSLDGPKYLHDCNRKSRIYSSSYDAFIKNSKKVRDILGKEGCSPLLTITRSNIHRLREVIDEYVKLGYKAVFLRALNPYGNAVINKENLDYSIEDFVEAYKDALSYIIGLNKKGIEFTECFTSLFLSRILTPFSTGFVDLQSPSGAGISGTIYNYDGKIYPADEARMLAKMGDDYFCMGTVDNDYKNIFNGKVLNDIVYNSCVETMPVCSECVYQQYCGADVIRNYLETNDLMGKRLTSGFCKKNKMILDYIFSLLNQNDEQMLDIFWAWVTRRSYKEVNIEKN